MWVSIRLLLRRGLLDQRSLERHTERECPTDARSAHNRRVTLQPTLPLWAEPAPDHRDRILAHSEDRVAWLRARSRGITATDVAKLSSARSVQAVALETPDGVARPASGALELAEIKTTKSAWRSIPRSYLRQVWWQQYVLGAERTLLVWEQHDNFVPVNPEPECRWIERDENEIYLLVGLATQVLELL